MGICRRGIAFNTFTTQLIRSVLLYDCAACSVQLVVNIRNVIVIVRCTEIGTLSHDDCVKFFTIGHAVTGQ